MPLCVFCRREPAQTPWSPFCSDRCKLQDLARWLDGRYRVPADPIQADTEDDSDRAPRGAGAGGPSASDAAPPGVAPARAKTNR